MLKHGAYRVWASSVTSLPRMALCPDRHHMDPPSHLVARLEQGENHDGVDVLVQNDEFVILQNVNDLLTRPGPPFR